MKWRYHLSENVYVCKDHPEFWMRGNGRTFLSNTEYYFMYDRPKSQPEFFHVEKTSFCLHAEIVFELFLITYFEHLEAQYWSDKLEATLFWSSFQSEGKVCV